MLNFDEVNHIISVNGGDPFDPSNVFATYKICKEFKKQFPDKKIWIWSYSTYEELLSEEYELSLDLYDYIDNIPFLILSLTDVLVDGRFIKEKDDPTVGWRRFIDVQKSIRSPEVVLYDS